MPRSGLALLLFGLLGLCARRLHAIDARTVVECQFDPKGPAVAGPRRLMRRRPFRRPIAGILSTTRAKSSRARSWSIRNARYLYYVLPGGKAIRYGVTVGEEALAWSGVATVGRMAEWPDWIPTAEIQARLGPYPKRVAGGPANPLGARALYLYEGNKDTLYRIHGTNQPEYIGHAISSGCIRMTNEDVIDLVDRVKPGAIVVVLPPGRSAWLGPVAGSRG